MATTTTGIDAAEIAEAAANPTSFSVDGLSQSNRSIGDLIAADKYLRKMALLSSNGGKRRHPLAGLVSHIIPAGPCDR